MSQNVMIHNGTEPSIHRQSLLSANNKITSISTVEGMGSTNKTMYITDYIDKVHEVRF